MTKDDKEIVSALHHVLADRVGQERFAMWFGRGVRIEPSGATLRISAADRFRLDIMRRQFRNHLLEAAQLVVGRPIEIEFVLEAEAAIAVAAPATAGDCPVAAPVRGAPRALIRQQVEAASAVDAVRPKLPKRHFASLSEFIVSESNRVAHSAAVTAATRPGTYTPLTFVGPPGCGKTHLLEGIWRQARSERTLQRVLYLSAEQFTNQFLDALRESGTPNFRRKIRDAEMLLIDDVQFFAGKQSTLVEVAHTIDALARGGRQLVFTVDRAPGELPALGREIIARLTGGLVLPLQPADCATRLMILQQMAARQALSIPCEVAQWLATRLEGDARHLAGALNRLRAASEAHQEAITLGFAQASLADLVATSRRAVRFPDIVEAVCDVFGVDEESLQSPSKAACVAVPRMLVMFLARKWTRAALSEISHKLGRKSHSTVLSAQEKIQELLTSNETVPLLHSQCRIEDAINRVEAKLRVS